MHKRIKNRLLLIGLVLFSGFLGTYLILYNLEQNIIFFYPPSKIREIKTNKESRVGGLVKAGSIEKTNLKEIKFVITDNIQDLTIFYQGVLPALFRENQGVVASGKLQGNSFRATELLIKHDENYMPPEIAKNIKY